VTLSEAGQTYAVSLSKLLDDLDVSTICARAKKVDRLRVLATPGFAARWLLPRLLRFNFAQAVRLRVAQGAPSTDFASNDADVVIQWRDHPSSGIIVWPFLCSSRYPIAAPELAEREKIKQPRDLLRLTLFQDEDDDMWSDWFKAAGVAGRINSDGPVYPNCEYATTAAEAGLGVALGYDAVVRETVAQGRLTKLFEVKTTPFTIYAIACKAGREHEPLISAFRGWLLKESKSDNTLPDLVLSQA